MCTHIPGPSKERQMVWKGCLSPSVSCLFNCNPKAGCSYACVYIYISFYTYVNNHIYIYQYKWDMDTLFLQHKCHSTNQKVGTNMSQFLVGNPNARFFWDTHDTQKRSLPCDSATCTAKANQKTLRMVVQWSTHVMCMQYREPIDDLMAAKCLINVVCWLV